MKSCSKIFAVLVSIMFAINISNATETSDSTPNDGSNSFSQSWDNFKTGMGQFGHSLNSSLVQTKQAFVQNFSSDDSKKDNTDPKSSSQ